MSLSSCYVNRTDIAGYNRDFGEEKMYDRAKQFYLLEGLIPLGRATLKTPPDGICQVRSYYSPLDFLFTAVTGGLFSMRTVKCYTIEPGTDLRDLYHPGDTVRFYDKKMKKNVEATIVVPLNNKELKVRQSNGQIRKIKVKDVGGRED